MDTQNKVTDINGINSPNVINNVVQQPPAVVQVMKVRLLVERKRSFSEQNIQPTRETLTRQPIVDLGALIKKYME